MFLKNQPQRKVIVNKRVCFTFTLKVTYRIFEKVLHGTTSRSFLSYDRVVRQDLTLYTNFMKHAGPYDPAESVLRCLWIQSWYHYIFLSSLHFLKKIAIKVGLSCCRRFLPNYSFLQLCLKNYYDLFCWCFKMKINGF